MRKGREEGCEEYRADLRTGQTGFAGIETDQRKETFNGMRHSRHDVRSVFVSLKLYVGHCFLSRLFSCSSPIYTTPAATSFDHDTVQRRPLAFRAFVDSVH